MLEVKINQKLEKLYNEAEHVRLTQQGREAKKCYVFNFSWLSFKNLVSQRRESVEA